MRINFVTQWFPPEPGTVVASAIADGLAECGHEVHVLTGFPNYPTGRLQAGYPLRPYRVEVRSPNVTIHRAPLFPSHSTSARSRILNYLSYGISATIVGRTKLARPDAWLTYSSPATALLPSLLPGNARRAPSYMIVQDLWPDSVMESGLVGDLVRRCVGSSLHAFCNWTYRRSAGIGVIAPSMRDVLVGRGVPSEKIHFTPNWVQDDHLSPETTADDKLRASLGLSPGRLFMYAGNMGELQGLDRLIDAFAAVPEARFVLIGGGVARAALEERARSLHAENVTFLDAVPTSEIGRFLAASDVQVVSLKDTALLRATMPSKVQTAMAAARPVLAHAAGDVADLVTHTGSGVVAPPQNAMGAARAIHAMTHLPAQTLVEMGRRARSHYEANFSPLVGVERLETMLLTHTQFGRSD